MVGLDQTTFNIAWVLSGLLLIPYLTWGIFLLRQRLVFDVELDRAVETFTVAALVFFFIFEFTLLKVWLEHDPVKLVFATLGLVVSALALYGPLLVSFGSHLFVDLIMPTGKYDANVPQYGAAEGCEMRGDFPAAAREFAAISRMFPRDARAPLRAADNFMKSGELDQAVPLFVHGLGNLKNPSEALRVTNRLCEIYLRQLDEPAKAKALLQSFLERFPDAEYAPSVQQRLERMKDSPAPALNEEAPEL